MQSYSYDIVDKDVRTTLHALILTLDSVLCTYHGAIQ